MCDVRHLCAAHRCATRSLGVQTSVSWRDGVFVTRVLLGGRSA